MKINVSGTKLGKTVTETFTNKDLAHRWAELLKKNGYVGVIEAAG